MKSTAQRVTHRLVDGSQVITPPGHHLLTPFVLAEQGDWFEDEIRFLRRSTEPGATVLDIGANYGTFALSLATAVGPEGSVIAVEPTPTTASCLRDSIAANGFSHLELVEAALSDREGTLHLRLEENSELNALADEPGQEERTVAVPSHTLDGLMASRGHPDLDFIKIDAEGAELRIIEGGKQTLRDCSPLILFETVHAGTSNVGLPEAFIALGYEIYLLVPGLQILAPYEPSEELDAFQLNLFACKSDRAANLEERGLLTRRNEDLSPAAPGILQDWLKTFPYCLEFAPYWQGAGGREGTNSYLTSLEQYAMAHKATELSPSKRLAALDAAIAAATEAVSASASAARRHSLARMLRERGARMASIQVLNALVDDLVGGTVEVEEPFFVADPEFDSIAPRKELGFWCLAAALTARIRSSSHSAYFNRDNDKIGLEALENMGFLSPTMARRLALLREPSY